MHQQSSMGTTTARLTRKDTSYQRGLEGEKAARSLLEKNNYAIIAERYRNEAGEIDLIAERDGHIAFIEVKRRKSHEEAAFAVVTRQQLRIARAAEGFLAEHEAYGQHTASFDVILCSPKEGLTHIEHAFSA